MARNHGLVFKRCWRALFIVAIAASSAAMFACGDDDAGVTPSSDAGDAGDAQTPEGGSDAGGAATLGGTCSKDDDCTTGLVCWTRASGDRGWPAQGVCSKKCSSSSECAAIDPKSVCFTRGGATGDGNYCAEPCTLGSKKPESFQSGTEPTKCHGRADHACAAFGQSVTCQPSCNDDSACGSDAFCNGATGLCESAKITRWEDIGTPRNDAGGCDPGLFAVTTSGVNLCSVRCTIGVLPSCRWNGTPPAQAACVYRPSAAGAGDLGHCGRLCDCHRDCLGGLLCAAGNAAFKTATGREGICGGNGTPLPCADAGDGG